MSTAVITRIGENVLSRTITSKSGTVKTAVLTAKEFKEQLPTGTTPKEAKAKFNAYLKAFGAAANAHLALTGDGMLPVVVGEIKEYANGRKRRTVVYESPAPTKAEAQKKRIKVEEMTTEQLAKQKAELDALMQRIAARESALAAPQAPAPAPQAPAEAPANA